VLIQKDRWVRLLYICEKRRAEKKGKFGRSRDLDQTKDHQGASTKHFFFFLEKDKTFLFCHHCSLLNDIGTKSMKDL
jgi:hypothetical protein